MKNPFANLLKKLRQRRKEREQAESDLVDSVVGDKSNKKIL